MSGQVEEFLLADANAQISSSLEALSVERSKRTA